MENHQRVVELALCFDALVFGGYIRDVVICKKDTFHDIDILWYNTIHNSLENFISVLIAEPWVTSHDIVKNPQRKYGDDKSVIHIILNKELHIDVVKYYGTRSAWLSGRDCDFSCNLFYKSRLSNISLRYVPDSFTFCSDPFSHIYNLTAEKKFSNIGTNDSDRYWERAARRATKLVKDGWVLEGKFITQEQLNRLGNVFPLVVRSVKLMKKIINEGALDVLVPTINQVCAERIRKKLFESDSDDDLDSSVGSQNSGTDL